MKIINHIDYRDGFLRDQAHFDPTRHPLATMPHSQVGKLRTCILASLDQHLTTSRKGNIFSFFLDSSSTVAEVTACRCRYCRDRLMFEGINIIGHITLPVDPGSHHDETVATEYAYYVRRSNFSSNSYYTSSTPYSLPVLLPSSFGAPLLFPS